MEAKEMRFRAAPNESRACIYDESVDLAQRVILPELLDDAPFDRARRSLNDLVRINRYFGGYRVLRKIVGELARPDEEFTLLDVGAASGDMGAALRRAFPRARITSLDYLGSHLIEAAPPRLIGDAFHLPLSARSFDFVFSSLFLHHFDNDEIVRLLASFGEVARRAVLAIDLERGPFAYHFLSATRWLFDWDPITMNDGPISVGAAFKPQELLALAQRAGLGGAKVHIHRPWSRLSLVAPALHPR